MKLLTLPVTDAALRASRARALVFEDPVSQDLDEIGALPPALQVKLLRVLQEREVVRLDLFFRPSVAGMTLAPLRDRPGDIVPLAGDFLDLHARRLGVEKTTLTPAAIERLLQHPWPGNIRALEPAAAKADPATSQGVGASVESRHNPTRDRSRPDVETLPEQQRQGR